MYRFVDTEHILQLAWFLVWNVHETVTRANPQLEVLKIAKPVPSILTHINQQLLAEINVEQSVPRALTRQLDWHRARNVLETFIKT